MKTAVVALISESSSLGQSIGCVFPAKREMKLSRLVRICNRIASGRPSGRASINILGGHPDIPGSCISVAFHLQVSGKPMPIVDLSKRADVIRNWLRDEFSVEAFDEKIFPSRVEFCDYLRDPLVVM
jgi:hypothetical protein